MMPLPTRRRLLQTIGGASTFIGVEAMAAKNVAASRGKTPHSRSASTVPDLKILNNRSEQQRVSFAARPTSNGGAEGRGNRPKELNTAFNLGPPIRRRVEAAENVKQVLKEVNQNRGNRPAKAGPPEFVVNDSLDIGGGEYVFAVSAGEDRDSIRLKVGDDGISEWTGIVVRVDEANVDISLEMV